MFDSKRDIRGRTNPNEALCSSTAKMDSPLPANVRVYSVLPKSAMTPATKRATYSGDTT